jgi:hypothetical protein
MRLPNINQGLFVLCESVHHLIIHWSIAGHLTPTR